MVVVFANVVGTVILLFIFLLYQLNSFISFNFQYHVTSLIHLLMEASSEMVLDITRMSNLNVTKIITWKGKRS